MTKTLFTILGLAFFTTAIAQKTAFKIAVNSGLFYFAGKSAAKTSVINYNRENYPAYTNNPYGSKNALCYGLSANIEHVSKSNFLAGLDVGYECLRSKIEINGVSGYAGASAANGQTFLDYGFVNLYPFIGYRVKMQKTDFQINGGFDLAYCLSATERGSATAADGKKFTTLVDRKTINKDIRPRIEFSANYKKYGCYIGYSYGFANYQSGYIGGVNECYAHLIRFGLTYKIN
jgi:hypothetical protein